jgi:hypothetical protein
MSEMGWQHRKSGMTSFAARRACQDLYLKTDRLGVRTAEVAAWAKPDDSKGRPLQMETFA